MREDALAYRAFDCRMCFLLYRLAACGQHVATARTIILVQGHIDRDARRGLEVTKLLNAAQSTGSPPFPHEMAPPSISIDGGQPLVRHAAAFARPGATWQCADHSRQVIDMADREWQIINCDNLVPAVEKILIARRIRPFPPRDILIWRSHILTRSGLAIERKEKTNRAWGQGTCRCAPSRFLR